MTPQERERVVELFDRLAQLESHPRDPEAERAIADGLRRAPNAVYALVQTTLVQDDALKAADARLRELEGPEAAEEPRGFLDSMRDGLLGRRGSVPSVPAGGPMWGNRGVRPDGLDRTAAQPMALAGSPGGSFLGTAAAAAVGMIGGGLLLDGIRNMMGANRHSAFDQTNTPTEPRSPWGGQESDLSRQAGLDDIGKPRQAALDNADTQPAGLVDTAQNDTWDTDDDVGGGDLGGDSDLA